MQAMVHRPDRRLLLRYSQFVSFCKTDMFDKLVKFLAKLFSFNDGEGILPSGQIEGFAGCGERNEKSW